MQQLYRYVTNINVSNIDFLKERLFLDESLNDKLNSIANLNCVTQNYSWGEIVIPQQLPFTIDGKADDWTDYQPVLTDKTGDSKTGSVMDFEALYMAQDDNYLYLMLKAGDKPGGEWASWAVDFYADLFTKNSCGNPERLIEIWSVYPDKFIIYSLDDCKDTMDPQGYPVEYIWGTDGLEVRIHFAYLKNPPEFEVINAKGVLIDSQGQLSNPDYMN